MTISDVRKLRILVDVPQGELAKAIPLDYSVYCKLENGLILNVPKGFDSPQEFAETAAEKIREVLQGQIQDGEARLKKFDELYSNLKAGELEVVAV